MQAVEVRMREQLGGIYQVAAPSRKGSRSNLGGSYRSSTWKQQEAK